jgi:hypothetical protein
VRINHCCILALCYAPADVGVAPFACKVCRSRWRWDPGAAAQQPGWNRESGDSIPPGRFPNVEKFAADVARGLAESPVLNKSGGSAVEEECPRCPPVGTCVACGLHHPRTPEGRP